MTPEIFNIHSAAKENFDTKVALLIKQITISPRNKTKATHFESEVHVAASITDKEIIGEPQEAIVDYRGNTVGRFFTCRGERYGLIDDGHKKLVRLAESIQKLPAFREKLSKNFIEECIFEWLRIKVTDPTDVRAFMSFLEFNAEKVVKTLTVLIPIANTTIETPFEFCGTTVCNISKAFVDEIAKITDSLPGEEQKAGAKKFFADFRKKYQGYAAVQISLTCEKNYANELAIEIASRVTDLLGIYSGAVLLPDVKCTSRMKGTENLAQYSSIIQAESGELTLNEGILDRSSARQWNISKLNLINYIQCGLESISNIAIKENRTEFESTILNMAFLYSKAAFTSDPMEKLVHMLSALESTLLRNESEPIQQNLAERVAFFTSQEINERKNIIKNIKHVYGLRSRYLHHGNSSNELEELSEFFLNVWEFYINLIYNSSRFKNKTEFLDAIDDKKLA